MKAVNKIYKILFFPKYLFHSYNNSYFYKNYKKKNYQKLKY